MPDGKTEPAVIAHFAQHHASLSACFAQVGKRLDDERAANSLGLVWRRNRYRPKPIPPAFRAADLYRRDGAVAANLTFNHCDKGQG